MYCTGCGLEVAPDHRYCPNCGTLSYGAQEHPGHKAAPRLSRPMADKKIAGVCAGIARYLEVDVTLIRVLVAILSVYPPGLGILFYIVCWIVMPRDEQRTLPVATVRNDAPNTAS